MQETLRQGPGIPSAEERKEYIINTPPVQLSALLRRTRYKTALRPSDSGNLVPLEYPAEPPTYEKEINEIR